MDFEITVTRGTAFYFSYAAMILPSNDAFIANGNPKEHLVFNSGGLPRNIEFEVLGSEVLDAGTEVNDELPMNTAFFGQMVPNTGIDENGVVGPHPGFKPAGSGGILDDAMFAAGDFTSSGYKVIKVEVTFDNMSD